MSSDARLSRLEKTVQKTRRGDEPIHVYVINDEKQTVTRDGVAMDWNEYQELMTGGIHLPDNGRGDVSDIFINLSYVEARHE